ncbi:MAG: hypothetical protein RR500_07560 [Bacilli bacterium]
MKIMNYYNEVSFVLLSFVSFMLGLLLGFPVFLGVLFLFSSNVFMGFLIFFIVISLIIGSNLLLSRFRKKKDKVINCYVKMIISFILLGSGMMLSSSLSTLFMHIGI